MLISNLYLFHINQFNNIQFNNIQFNNIQCQFKKVHIHDSKPCQTPQALSV